MFLDAGQIISGYAGIDENGLPYDNFMNKNFKSLVNTNCDFNEDYNEKEKLQIIQEFMLDYTEDDIEKMFNMSYEEFEKLYTNQKFELINLRIIQKQKILTK